MKIFISADIKGTYGIVNVDETNINSQFSMYHIIQMTKEIGCAYIAILY